MIYSSAFAKHEFFDEAKGRAESDWLVKTGEAQVEFWDILFGGMFDEVVHIRDWETVQSRGPEIDGVLIPAIADLQYTIPTHTNVKIYEIWMRYEFRLVDVAAIHQQEDGALSFNPTSASPPGPSRPTARPPPPFCKPMRKRSTSQQWSRYATPARTSPPHSAPRPTSQSGSTVSLDASRR